MDKLFSGLKVLGIILLVIVVLSVMYYTIVSGIIDTIVSFFANLAGEVAEQAKDWLKSVKVFFGISVVQEGMYIRPISQEAIDGLKAELESVAVSTDKVGLTEEMLRKMLLSESATSSTVDTLCVAEIEPIEILRSSEDFKDKEDLESNVNNYLYQYFNSLKLKSSKSAWPKDVKYDYALYYATDNLYYFRDKDNMIGNGNDKYYLATMGLIEIKSTSGKELNYVNPTEFADIRTRYEADPDNEDRKNELLYNYTFNDNGEMKVHKIINNINSYGYVFKENDDCMITKERRDEKNSSSNVEEVVTDIQNTVDSSLYDISIELLTNFLDLTGSPEYVDEFIDYAIENTKVTITAYPIETDEKSYDIDTYNIEDNFIYEVYDIVDGGIDLSVDNMKTYKSLIYDRIYEGEKFDCSVVKLKDFESIDYYELPEEAKIIDKVENYYITHEKQIYMSTDPDGTQGLYNLDFKGHVKRMAGNTEKEIRTYLEEDYDYTKDNKIKPEEMDILVAYICNGEDPRSKVNPIHKYLKSAYDPGDGFDLGKVEVQEVSINNRHETSWQFYATNISTWYGNIEYNNITTAREYTINEKDSTEDEYNKLVPKVDGNGSAIDYSNMIELVSASYKDVNYDEITKIMISEARENELKSEGNGIGSDPNVQVVSTEDIFSNILKQSDNGIIMRDLKVEKKEDYFKYWTLAGLGEITLHDNGKYGKGDGAFEGTDYAYIKYKPINGKDYETIIKSYYDVIEITTVLPTVSVTKVEEFLALWKNETGTIGDTNYNSNGKLVAYDDIYNGKTRVGDIFESAPEMTFDLLESSDSTKGLVNIFKYIMYKYTGTDYGITEESQIAFIFDISPYGGSDYIVNTPMSDSNLVLTKEQLEKAIKNSYRGNTQKNLLSCLDDFMNVQENNKVNSVFAVAVTIIESSGGTNWAAIDPSTCNWYSIKGSYNGNSKNGWRAYSSFNEATRDFGDLIANSAYYFKAGKYTVSAIAPTYCNEEWGNSVVAEMTKIYNSIGISGATGGIEGTEGDITTFTVGNRTYKNYKQIVESYKSIPLACYPGSTLYSAGCGLTSDAIIGSGFGSNSTPVDVNRLNSNNHPSILKKLTGKEWVQYWSFSKTAVINELKKGNPVIVRFEGNGGFATSRGHFVAILSISEDGSKMYVSNPSSYSSSKTGWLKTSYLDASGYCQYIKLK